MARTRHEAGTPGEEASFVVRPGAFSWLRVISAGLGVWLVISAFVWPHTRVQSINAIVCGVLAFAFAGVAMRVRRARYLSTALGLWVFFSPFVLATGRVASSWNELFVGSLLVALSLVRGRGRDDWVRSEPESGATA